MSSINDLSTNGSPSLYDIIYEKVKNIDTSDLSDDVDQTSSSTVVEEQKVYFWTRLYLKDEIDISPGDDVSILYTESGEQLSTKFICFEKKGLGTQQTEDVTSYQTEEDKKILCLMVDSNKINYSEEIPFIRTLFKTGYHYEYQLVKRDELLFILDKSKLILDYYDVDF